MPSGPPIFLQDVVSAREALVELGLVEDSGERRRNPDGTLGIVWTRTPLAALVDDYEQSGLTFEEAIAKANGAVARPD